jgi:hypothetical protein
VSVHFDFVLSDADAENLFDLVTDAKLRAVDEVNNLRLPEAQREWWRRRAAYLLALQAKMANTRAGDSVRDDAATLPLLPEKVQP